MRRIKKVAAGILLGIGLPIILAFGVDFLNKNSPNKEGAIAALIFFGLPPTAAGGWLVWSLHKENQQAKLAQEKAVNDHLQAVFYQLIEAGNGQITVMRFAKETQLSGEEAKTYLDQKATEFDASFDVTPEGGISYHFNL